MPSPTKTAPARTATQPDPTSAATAAAETFESRSELVHLDPRALLITGNIRRRGDLTEEFVASIREHGVLVPIVALSTSEGAQVRYGQRRTLAAIEACRPTVPVMLLSGEIGEDLDRIVEQWHENEHRTGLSVFDQAAAEQLAAFGLSAEMISKRLRTPKRRIDRALEVAKSELASPDDFELAYELFQRIGPEAESIASLFTGMSVDSWAARAWRRQRDAESTDDSWDGADGFASGARQLLARIESGSPELFWHLAYQLQFDPRTGTGHDPTFNDDLLTYPGISVLGPDGPDRLRAAARAYLSHEDDQRTEWLGTSQYDKRAWAGYLALCIVDRDTETPSVVPWERWVGAIIWYLTESESADRHTRLVRAAADAAPDAFAEAFALFVKNTLERGSIPYGIDTIGTVIRPELGQQLLALLRSIRAAIEHRSDADIVLPQQDAAENLAVQAWRDLASLLIHAEVDGGVDEARAALTFQQGNAPTPLALAAAAVLMSTEPSSAWPTIRDAAGTDPVTARPVVYAIANHNYYGVNLPALDDDDLVAFYLWLRELLPESDDINVQGVHVVDEHEEAQRLRGRTLEAVSQRATARTLELLREAIATEDAIELVSAERRVRSQLAEIGWAAPEVAELTEVIDDPSRRLVRSDSELARLVVETLHDIANRIPTHGELLWDRVPTAVATAAKDKGIRLRHPEADPRDDLWSPKTESALVGYLANQLELRLHRRVVVNREVLIKPTNAYGAGDHPDLLIQVRHQTAAPCTVPVEIKGNWNAGVAASITTQLADRYLPEASAKAGVYVVGWWPLDQWTVKGSRRTAAAARTGPELISTLTETAADLSRSRGVSITPMLLSIPRPAKATPAADRT
ncbi:MAG TPA: ParB N-terminal domain-containing protein [Jatrophihabitans sp.]|jgi:hypothetical protein|uniref:ParB/RepB/Spo0J family partition protein n=1 Tax=Jatrophihabitans sp. TaxID=1932789 RepID=UPI002EF994B2